MLLTINDKTASIFRHYQIKKGQGFPIKSTSLDDEFKSYNDTTASPAREFDRPVNKLCSSTLTRYKSHEHDIIQYNTV